MDTSSQCLACFALGLVGTQGPLCFEQSSAPDTNQIVHVASGLGEDQAA